ncbi:hypothetical protein [Pasteurella multocida]|uniref:hypothetical protein n=1 Tax=Pasteurella multocida TaxID=747 RepID=UPI000B152553|nr:hypothetical protein [Pasteurella multocida]
MGIELATPEQVHQLQQLIQLTNTNTLKAFAYYGVNTLEQLPKEKAEHFIRTLNQRLDEQSANVTENYVDEEIPLD